VPLTTKFAGPHGSLSQAEGSKCAPPVVVKRLHRALGARPAGPPRSSPSGKLLLKLYPALDLSLLALQAMLLLGAIARPAYAYVDPGSGLLVFQIVSTTFAGAVFLLRRRVRQFLEQIGWRPKANRKSDGAD
jgi:hypothetical protein